MSGEIKPVKDKKILAQFRKDFDYCWACGIPEYRATWGQLQTHHLIKFGRSDERCNLSRVCQRCHDLCEFHTIRGPGGLAWPWLTLPRMLWIKMNRDPENYDRKRLAVLYGKALPVAAKPPIVFMREWAKNQGGTGL